MFPVNWNPFDMFERMLSRWEPFAFHTMPVVQTVPHMTAEQTENEVILRLEVPGISPEDLEVTVDGKTITVRGTWRGGELDSAETSYGSRRYGQFERTVTMPPFVDLDRAQASYHQGVLEIRAPKQEERRGRQLKIDLK